MSFLIVFLFLLGIATVAYGTALIFIPAGVIAAGVGMILLAIVLVRGSGPDKP